MIPPIQSKTMFQIEMLWLLPIDIMNNSENRINKIDNPAIIKVALALTCSCLSCFFNAHKPV